MKYLLAGGMVVVVSSVVVDSEMGVVSSIVAKQKLVFVISFYYTVNLFNKIS